MFVNRLLRRPALAAMAGAMMLMSSGAAEAAPMTLTDIAGRQVTLDAMPKKIVLGEGRMIYSISTLVDGNPFEKLVGWRNELPGVDPDALRKYAKTFPSDIDRMIDFGNPYAGDFSVEAVLEAGADLMLLNLGNLFKAEETGLIDKLEKAGVPVVFVDFRRNPIQNTVPSLLILGRVFGEEKNAAEFIDFYITQMRRVANVVDTVPAEEKPLVVVETAAGLIECCRSFGPYNYGRFVELAGGVNLGSSLANAYSVTLSAEGVIEADPDHIIATGANWAETRPQVTSVLLGYEADASSNAAKLKALANRPGFADLRAIKQGNYHAIYHQFYNSPFHFVAIQQIAKWLYPEDFADLDPQATLDTLHNQFMPYKNSGQFWASLGQ